MSALTNEQRGDRRDLDYHQTLHEQDECWCVCLGIAKRNLAALDAEQAVSAALAGAAVENARALDAATRREAELVAALEDWHFVHDAMVAHGMTCTGTHTIGEADCQHIVLALSTAREALAKVTNKNE